MSCSTSSSCFFVSMSCCLCRANVSFFRLCISSRSFSSSCSRCLFSSSCLLFCISNSFCIRTFSIIVCNSLSFWAMCNSSSLLRRLSSAMASSSFLSSSCADFCAAASSVRVEFNACSAKELSRRLSFAIICNSSYSLRSF